MKDSSFSEVESRAGVRATGASAVPTNIPVTSSKPKGVKVDAEDIQIGDVDVGSIGPSSSVGVARTFPVECPEGRALAG